MNTTTTMSFGKHFTTASAHIPSTPEDRHGGRLQPLKLLHIKCKSSSSDRKITTTGNGSVNASPPVPQPTPPPDTTTPLYRRGRRRSIKEQQAAVATGPPKKVEKKDWDSMTMSEKAIELYVGEKGLLFWLNKLAYASIFVVIGAWILFRFVGPALNLYQLDAAPLPPTAMFKGS